MPHDFRHTAPQNRQTAQNLITTTGAQGGAAREAGLAGALAFDPSQAVSEFGQGFLADAREGLGEEFENLVGGSVGAGRLRTGFFQRDAKSLFTDFNRRVSQAIAQASLQASGQRLQNIQGLQRFGSDLLGQQTDLLGGALDRATAEENADQGGFGNFLGRALGFAAGTVVPGIGNIVGERIGNAITS